MVVWEFDYPDHTHITEDGRTVMGTLYIDLEQDDLSFVKAWVETKDERIDIPIDEYYMYVRPLYWRYMKEELKNE